MDKVEKLILKILEYKNDTSLDEIKVDLQRVCANGFGNYQEDIGYIRFLFKYYAQEINFIENRTMKIGMNTTINTRPISALENIRNYLIKIAVIRICKQKLISCQIESLDDPNYCINIIDSKCD